MDFSKTQIPPFWDWHEKYDGGVLFVLTKEIIHYKYKQNFVSEYKIIAVFKPKNNSCA